MPFENLIDLYTSSHVALITPVRDGMNLVAKEYIATRTNGHGVLVLSEMAGAAKEMNEALLINPNNFEQIADSLKYALEMPEEEQARRLNILQKRLKRYSVEKWADEFMISLNSTKKYKETSITRALDKNVSTQMVSDFENAKKNLLLLDYDGTLVGFTNNPQDASPDSDLIELLEKLDQLPNTDLVLISGRDRVTFQRWLSDYDFNLITDHGVWLKSKNKDWKMLEQVKTQWMENIKPILETFVDRTPGTFIEKKRYSLAWHYRKADPELAEIRTMELNTVLTSLISNNDLSVLEGNKVIEIKSSNVNKGRATSRLITAKHYDNIVAIGDDWTDEFTFEALPVNSYTIKVGSKKTKANYYIKDTNAVRELLVKFVSD